MTLIEHLSVVKDTRSDINRQYDLIDVIFLVVSAIMAGSVALTKQVLINVDC